MRCLKLEIAELDTDSRRRWWSLCDQAKQVVNRIWRKWLVYHSQNDSELKLRTFLNSLAAWNAADKKTRGEKPKNPVNCITNDLWNAVYADLRATFPDWHTRPLTLLMNSERGKITALKASKGSLPGWVAILLDQQGLPSSTRPIPVPFDAANTKVTTSDDESVQVTVNLERPEIDGKKQTISVTFGVITTGKARRYAEPIQAVATGTHKLKGSSVMYDQGRKKWYMLVAYEPCGQEKPNVDPTKAMILRAAYRTPWRVRIAGRSWRVGSDGKFIAERRREVLMSRWNRQNNYRWAATSTKGHGRERALQSPMKLSRSWNLFVKTYNQQVVAEVIRQAVSRGCGRIVLLKDSPGRFLEKAGKVEGRHDSTAWAWFQFEAILKDHCHPLGIKVETRKASGKVKAGGEAA